MKKYVLAASVAAALVAVPTVAYAVAPPSTPAAAAPAKAAPAAKPSPTTAPIRIVEPNEQVDAGRGWKVWLTEEGKHWSGPDGYENFRSVVDGNIDLSRPGVSHQTESDRSGSFHSGVYYGTKNAARVELTYSDGRKTPAILIELPGKPGWGAWYVNTPPTASDESPGVTLHDTTGALIAELRGAPPG
ncbi:hypothetical protein [Streptomyces sp. TRM49041]|uniref:hypothetical protein n=1 Tax=Streptomyces sp. TRM49041 TaxID=2603216 RepID=UPI0011EEE177|nr:hypothetical protein [Streptomyces sp. TRM49041]